MFGDSCGLKFEILSKKGYFNVLRRGHGIIRTLSKGQNTPMRLNADETSWSGKQVTL
jgi:hypothetical protein